MKKESTDYTDYTDETDKKETVTFCLFHLRNL